MPCDYRNYPKNWKAIRAEILERSKSQCECWGECGDPHNFTVRGMGKWRCLEMHGAQAAKFNGRVCLTIAHLNHKTRDSRRKNLKAMCQRCHNRYDRPYRDANRRAKRELKMGPMLFQVNP